MTGIRTRLGVLRSHGREPEQRTLVARGVLLLTVLAVVVSLLVLVGRGAFSESVEVTVVLDDAGGSLVEGADVKHHGVVVGSVRALRRTTSAGRDAVEVVVRLDPDLADRVPRDTLARVLPATVFGTSFVDLVGGRGSALGIRVGQTIAQDTSRETLEVQNVLDGLDRVVGALGPARLARALDGLSGALEGNGEQLGRTIERVERYLTRLNPRMPLLRRNLQLLATNLEAFEEYAPDLFRATDDVLVVARTLIEREQDFAGLVTSGSRTFRDTDRLLERNRRALAATLVRTAVVVDTLHEERRGLVHGLLETLRLAERFVEALSQGNYLKIDGTIVLRHGEKFGRRGCPSYSGHRGRDCR